MFDDQQQEAQDMFSEVSSSQHAAVPSSAQEPTPQDQQSELAQPQENYSKEHGFSPKLIIVVVSVLAVLVVGAVALQYILRNKTQPNANQIMPLPVEPITEQPTQTEPSKVEGGAVTPLPVSETVEQQQDEVSTLQQETLTRQSAPPLDSDSDGLTDERESTLGTSPILIDTDQDGLNDNDEVLVYMTDPLMPDTDGDTFLDGQEVQNGYNPRGAGKLEAAKPVPSSQTSPDVLE